jgi:alkyl hydroperoxide reductase subunit AhpC
MLYRFVAVASCAIAWHGFAACSLPAQQPAQPAAPIVDPKTAEGRRVAAAVLETGYEGSTPPEAVRMLTAILRGSQMGPGEGWFGPAQTRLDWAWLAKQCGVESTAGRIPRAQFRGPDPWFARLDRDKNGAITPDDLDWSDRQPFVQMSSLATRLFRRLDSQADGQLSKDEVLQFFDRAAQGKDHVTVGDFRDALLGGMSSGFNPGDGPTPAVLVRGLFAGEIGSMHEGPAVGQVAPNFVLKTVDGQGKVELSKRIGPKPVVLVFGNFTCGPFRGLYPEVELVHQRWKNDADFVMVYVREAHPTNGWKMSSNERAGIAVPQPTTWDERTKVAEQFCSLHKPSLPVAVDDISDVVGNAYSGMPARLYVIDPQGKVAYKSGRGPFGFRPSEMEQALLMCLLEALPR